jgi:hypothetical protein
MGRKKTEKERESSQVNDIFDSVKSSWIRKENFHERID